MSSGRKRQSFDVHNFRDAINEELRDSGDTADYRRGLSEALEAALDVTRQYAGFEYLPEAEVHRNPQGRVTGIVDPTRRRYLSLEEAEHDGALRLERLRERYAARPTPALPAPATKSTGGLKGRLRAANNSVDDTTEDGPSPSRASPWQPASASRRASPKR